MAANVLADTGFILALLRRRDGHHAWAASAAREHSPPWLTCEAVLSETYFILGDWAGDQLAALLQQRLLVPRFSFEANAEPVLALLKRYAEVPMSFADACLVRMTEIVDDPMLLTTDSDFRIYRRLGRKIIPAILPG